MRVEHFYDTGLAHSSYAVESDGKMVLIDPARDPQQYYEMADKHNAEIVGVIETHPHADFVSSHLQIHKEKGAEIFVSKYVGADYPHRPFDDGDIINFGDVLLKAVNTPGHSPDSITILLEDKKGNLHSLFTGDTLFIGDVGRPDLRENVGNMKAKRRELAEQMYDSTRNKLMKLQEDAIVYPAHGSGSLCGKAISEKLSDTLGNQLENNPALQEMGKEEFIDYILDGQPFIPKYFPYDVELNKKGAPNFKESVDKVKRVDSIKPLKNDIVIDTRPEDKFKQSYTLGSINLPDDESFESWLGAIVAPEEKYILVAEDEESRERMIAKAAKIGYEQNIKAAVLDTKGEKISLEKIDIDDFNENQENYTIIDVRNPSEVEEEKIFESAVNIPLYELRDKAELILTDKPVAVHCAEGFRSAAASSIINNVIGDETDVFDISVNINDYRG